MKRQLIIVGSIAAVLIATSACAAPAGTDQTTASASTSASVPASPSATVSPTPGPADLATRKVTCQTLQDATRGTFLKAINSAITLQNPASTPDQIVQAGRDLMTTLTAQGTALVAAAATADPPLKAAATDYASQITVAIAGIQSAGPDAAKIQAAVSSAIGAQAKVNDLCAEAGVNLATVN